MREIFAKLAEAIGYKVIELRLVVNPETNEVSFQGVLRKK